MTNSPPRRSGAGRGLVLAALVFFAACSARVTPPEDQPLAYRQAEDAFRLGDFERAVHNYQIFLRSGEAKDLVPRAYYRMALAEFRRGRYDDSLAVLDEMERRFPEKQWSEVYELRGDDEEARGNIVSAVRWWEFAWKTARGEDKRALHQRISAALSHMDEAALTRTRPLLSTNEFRSLVDARLRGATLPAPPTPRPSGATPGAAAPPAPPTDGQAIVQPRVGVLLPQSGPLDVYGQRSLEAIRLAFAGDSTELVIRDTQGKISVARDALDRLIADPNVIAVIGPLRSKVAEAVAPRAERAELPMIVLSQRSGITGGYVIQPAMTYRRQAVQLADYAVDVRGLRRFAVISPRDSYGSALAQAFRDEVEQRGGQVVGSLIYEPHATEFSVEALSVERWVERDGLQAVFVPDFASTAIALGARLRQADPGLVLLGSNGWHAPNELAEAPRELDGAVFIDGFFARSQRPATRRFVNAYQQAYQSTPDILEAQAYDAAMLIRSTLGSGARSRTQVIPALHQLGRIEGASGTITVEPDGAHRELFLLRLDAGTITEIPYVAPRAGAATSAPEVAAPASPLD